MERPIARSVATARLSELEPQPPKVLPQLVETRLSAATLWSGLADGQLRLCEQRLDRLATCVVLQERDDAPVASAVSARRRRILELILSGSTENAIAIELGLAASTVCADFRRAMVGLGLVPRLSALPLCLAQFRQLALSDAWLDVDPGYFGQQASRCLTVVLPRPDLDLGERLSPAELEVCRLLLRGWSHAAIAAERGTSVRTTANQLATVFAKMKVSGRLELLVRLAAGKGFTTRYPPPANWSPELAATRQESLGAST